MKSSNTPGAVGAIPEDWEYQTLGALTKADSPICYGIVQPGRHVDNGVPVLAIKNLNTDYYTQIHRTAPAIEKAYTRSRIRPGDVLLSVKGTTGRVGLVPPHFHGNISRDLARIRLASGNEPEFWFQMLQSESAQRALDLAVVGTTRLELSIGTIKQIRFLRPPIAEQRRIAAMLGNVDAQIGSLDQLTSKKRDIKQAAMHEFLTGRRRVDGFGGVNAEHKLSDLGAIPADWQIEPLGSAGQWLSGGTPRMSMETYWNGDVPWVSPKDMKAARLYDATDHVSYRALGNGTRLAPAHAVLMVVRGMILAHSFPVARAERPLAFNQDIKALVVRQCHDSNFMLYWLQANEDRILCITDESTHGTKRIPTEALFAQRVAFPPLGEQRAIAAVLSDMEAEIASLEARREKTRAIKQGMMQELLTGRARLV